MAVSDVARHGVEATLQMAERVCRRAVSGTVIVQLRDRELPIRERFLLGSQLREITRRAGQWLCVGERLDLALILDADALHLPESGPDPTRVRQWLRRRGRSLWLSRAVHGLDPLPADCDGYLFAPVAAARKGRPAQGLEALQRVIAAAPAGTRVFALGGLGADNAASCLSAGASVAAMGSVYSETERLLHALGILRGDEPL